MTIGLQRIKLRAMRMVAAFMTVAVVGAASVAGSASALTGPKYFDVPKGGDGLICFTLQAKNLGFKTLDQCLRWVDTPGPQVKADCDGGWWFVYGFQSIGHCKLWVTLHGGGYDGHGNGNGHGHGNGHDHGGDDDHGHGHDH